MSDPLTSQFIKDVQQKTGIIGDSESIQNAVKTMLEVADTRLTVLITGETGTGKEVFASALHSLSQRASRPFVSVNCGAIPETLLESELFGHEKGAFTSAESQRIGFFEAANNGTIFLDEIGEMPLLTQVKLLRVLESGEFSRLGSSHIHKVNVRMIAATNRELTAEVAAKRFRSDLFYRLNQVNIALPPLREHIHDIPLYFKHFAASVCKRNNIHYQDITEDALTKLKSLNWQGNIREFKNFTEKVITLERGRRIDADTVNKYIRPALPDVIAGPQQTSEALVPLHKEPTNIMSSDTLILRTLLEIKQDIAGIKQLIAGMGSAFQLLENDMNAIKDSVVVYQMTQDTSNNTNPITTIKEMERQLITRTLEHCHYRKREAATMLGIAERTLYRKIEEYNIEDYT